MRLLLTGFALLMLSFFVHLLVWRVRIPKRPIFVLLRVFTLTPLVVVAIATTFGTLPAFTSIAPSDAFRILLFYFPCSLVYICVYSAVEEQSPSLTIISHIASCGGAGCADAELSNQIGTDDSLNKRISALQDGKLIAIHGEKCALTSQGRLWGALFEGASKIFRLRLGG
jgi:hypothetical protein